MHAPPVVQHCAAILLPSGVAVAVGSVMQTPSERVSLEPWRAITRNGGGDGDGGGGDGDEMAGGGSRLGRGGGDDGKTTGIPGDSEDGCCVGGGR